MRQTRTNDAARQILVAIDRDRLRSGGSDAHFDELDLDRLEIGDLQFVDQLPAARLDKGDGRREHAQVHGWHDRLAGLRGEHAAGERGNGDGQQQGCGPSEDHDDDGTGEGRAALNESRAIPPTRLGTSPPGAGAVPRGWT